jgi:hypothetical protein
MCHDLSGFGVLAAGEVIFYLEQERISTAKTQRDDAKGLAVGFVFLT